MRVLELEWAAHRERGMATVPVVLVDPGGDPAPGGGLGLEGLQPPQLEGEGGVEGLDRGVVQRRSRSAHRLHDTEPGARGAELTPDPPPRYRERFPEAISGVC